MLPSRAYVWCSVGLTLVVGTAHLSVERARPAGVAPGESAPAHGVVRLLKSIEGRVSDAQVSMRGTARAHPDVVVVAIDEASVGAYGRWPWPRALIGRLIARLTESGATAIGLDIINPEASNAEDDAAMARALSRARGAVQGVVARGVHEAKAESESESESGPEQPALGPEAVVRSVSGRLPGSSVRVPLSELGLWTMSSVQPPTAVLAASGARLGLLNMVPDHDGVLRRAPPVAHLTAVGGLMFGLSIEVAAAHWGARPELVHGEAGVEGVRLRRPIGQGAVVVPFGEPWPLTLIDYPGPPSVFTVLSVRDVLEGTAPASALAGKAVLVGSTLAGASGDQRVTPFNENVPGVFVHASLLSNILDARFVRRSIGGLVLELLALVIAVAVFTFVIVRGRSHLLEVTLAAGVVTLSAVADQTALGAGWLVHSLVPSLGFSLVALALTGVRHVSVERERRALRQSFSRYLGEEVMAEVLQNPQKLSRGEKRDMTVLFADIRNFSALAESMEPSALARFVNAYFSELTQVVFEERGTLDKYIGDAVMAFWNAPLDQPDHAYRACRTALGFLRAIQQARAAWRAQGLPEVDIGIGISTGAMVVGDFGCERRVDYTVIGDAVNLAARLEALNKELATRMLISEATHAQVRERVTARRLGEVSVRGKAQAVRVFELLHLGPPDEAERSLIATFEAGVDALSEARHAEAGKCFERVVEARSEDGVARRLLALCRGCSRPEG